MMLKVRVSFIWGGQQADRQSIFQNGQVCCCEKRRASCVPEGRAGGGVTICYFPGVGVAGKSKRAGACVTEIEIETGTETETMDQDAGWTQIDFERDVEVGERIGGGGVGIIYKGWFKDEPVALKVMHVMLS